MKSTRLERAERRLDELAPGPALGLATIEAELRAKYAADPTAEERDRLADLAEAQALTGFDEQGVYRLGREVMLRLQHGSTSVGYLADFELVAFCALPPSMVGEDGA